MRFGKAHCPIMGRLGHPHGQTGRADWDEHSPRHPRSVVGERAARLRHVAAAPWRLDSPGHRRRLRPPGRPPAKVRQGRGPPGLIQRSDAATSPRSSPELAHGGRVSQPRSDAGVLVRLSAPTWWCQQAGGEVDRPGLQLRQAGCSHEPCRKCAPGAAQGSKPCANTSSTMTWSMRAV
jgi:hypothetical protein